MKRNTLRTILFAIALLICPARARAATTLDCGSAYIFSGYKTYKSTKETVMKAYPSGIAVAQAKGSARIKADGKAFSFKVRDQKGYTVKNSASFDKSVSVTLKAAKGYKVYYTTGNKYKASKCLKSKKSKTFTFKATTGLHVYAVKTGIKISELNKALKSGSDNVFLYTKYRQPVYTKPEIKATYGQKLSSLKLPAGYAWESSGLVGELGVNEFYVSYTPEDTMVYKKVNHIPVKVTVGKARPAYNLPTGITCIYGNDLFAAVLPQGFYWENQGSVGDVGTRIFKASFVPEDTIHYNVVKGIGISVKVIPADITEKEVTAALQCEYTGTAVKPEVVVDGLVKEKDYTVSYSNNTKPGTATITIKGTGNYTGTITRKFDITCKAAFLFQSLEAMAKNIKAAGLVYDNGASTTTFAKAKKNNKPYNCALYVSWTLQEMGLIPSGNTFWFNASGHGTAYTYVNNNPDVFQVLHPKKAAKNCDLVPGDICGFTINGSAAHTAVYAGVTSAGNMKWYSGGRTDFGKMITDSGTVKPVRFTYYEQDNDIIYTIIRIK